MDAPKAVVRFRTCTNQGWVELMRCSAATLEAKRGISQIHAAIMGIAVALHGCAMVGK